MPHLSWNESYASGELPWDTGSPEPLLTGFVNSGGVAPGRTLEIGAGTGTNSIWLAERGFDVVGVEVSPLARSPSPLSPLWRSSSCAPSSFAAMMPKLGSACRASARSRRNRPRGTTEVEANTRLACGRSSEKNFQPREATKRIPLATYIFLRQASHLLSKGEIAPRWKAMGKLRLMVPLRYADSANIDSFVCSDCGWRYILEEA